MAARSIAELKEEYQGQWLAIKVVDRDEYGCPLTGEVVASGRTHHELHTKLQNENVYETYAGELPTKAVLF